MTSNKFTEADHVFLEKCPWCFSRKRKKWGNGINGFKTMNCLSCGLIYVTNPLNIKGLQKLYSKYLTNMHTKNRDMVTKRRKMYKIEFEFVNNFMNQKKKNIVLDIGCSGGYFLDLFQKARYECYGVEFGEEAAKVAAKKYKIWYGNFADMSIDVKFNLIIFRGVIEHVSSPRIYLQKAMSLLKKNGLIYITSTPNGSSFCANLFREKWNQHDPRFHLMHFSPKHFDEFFQRNKYQKIAEAAFYTETPYASVVNDAKLVLKAILKDEKKKKINFTSPAFFGNMMSLVYRKY